MRTVHLNIKSLIVISLLFIGSCTYDFPDPDPNTLPSPGQADFTKMVSVGNSLTAGTMNATLYNASQQNSFVAIIAKQLESVGGGEFNQPDINAVNGCYNTANCAAAGRLYLKGLANPTPTPTTPGDPITPYTGNKATLNNFGVPGVTLGGALSTALTANQYYNRFASDPGNSTLIGDAANALANNGTFFTFWLGNNDVLGYATAGASAGGTLTSNSDFETRFNLALNAMLAANTNAKGAVANIPNVTSIPFFTTIKYNPIPLDENSATALTTNLANNYNGFLDYAVSQEWIEQIEADKRYLTYTASSTNKILINDETLTDLSEHMVGPFAGLAKYNIARQTTSSDLVCLTAGSYIGKVIDNNPSPAPDSVLGVSFPLYNTTNPLKGDDLILLPTEITQIQTAVTDFNELISTAVAANSGRLVLIDANTALASLPVTVNGIALTATISPPYGAFSLDGVHPNARGAAYIANIFITAINNKFGSRIPLCNPNDYPGNELPVP
jgi:hypothetical protein